MRNLVCALLVCGIIAAMAGGGATTAKGPTDEEQIMQRVQEMIVAVKAKNYSAFDAFISKSYYDPAIGDRDALLEGMKMVDSMGMADGVEFDVSQAKAVVTGNKCVVGPIVASGKFGSGTGNCFGAKVNGVWMITGGEQVF